MAGFANIGLMFFRKHAGSAPIELLNMAMEMLFFQEQSRVQGDQAAIHRSLCHRPSHRALPVDLSLSLTNFTLVAPSALTLGWDHRAVRTYIMHCHPEMHSLSTTTGLHPRFC